MITIRDLSYFYGEKEVFNNLNLNIVTGKHYAIIGDNGVGKSTLINLIAGKIIVNLGTIDLHNNKTVLFPQTLDEYDKLTLIELAKELLGFNNLEKNLELALNSISENPDAYQDILEELESTGFYSLESELKKAINDIGLNINNLDGLVGNLSGGQKAKLCLAIIKISRAEVLLFDEPTNNLDLSGIKLLEEYIKNTEKTCLIVSHDRLLLKRVAQSIIEIDKVTMTASIFNLTLENYIKEKEIIRNKRKAEYKEYIEELDRLRQTSKKSEELAQKAETENKTRDNDKMAKTKHMEKSGTSLARQSKSIQQRIDKLEIKEKLNDEVVVDLQINSTQHTGDFAVELKDLVYGYSEKKFGPLNLVIKGSDRVVIIGENGIGKSTLLKTILGQIKPITGKVLIPEGVKIGYLDQDQRSLDPNLSIIDAFKKLTECDNNKAFHALAKVGIEDEDTAKQVDKFSPGQKMRAILTSFAVRESNLLILDEPTNHIDIQTADSLEKSLETYAQALLVVTHDREFILSLKPNRIYKLSTDGIEEINIDAI